MKHPWTLIGCGTVGRGLLEILRDRGDDLRRLHDAEFPLVGVSDMKMGSAEDPAGLDLAAVLAAAEHGSFDGLPGADRRRDAPGLIREVDAAIVAEATFTNLETGEPALGHFRTALEHGRSVVTTNKGPIALELASLQDLAARHGADLRFEGTVMSGTPVLSLAMRDLAGDRIQEIRGILNGTTNYILTRMEGGDAYGDALAEAQRLGYAEAKPDADVEGHDAQAKVMILAAALMGRSLRASDVPCQGITGITPERIADARAGGRRYKLLGTVRRTEDGVEASVAPVAVELDDPLAGIAGVANAIHFRTELLGSLTVVGPGAGRRETGFSLLADMLAIHRRLAAREVRR
ncbi:MAG: homoserine dehydrogenase [Acidobacteriota bacterium]|jgi:homoserine dehydrogenase